MPENFPLANIIPQSVEESCMNSTDCHCFVRLDGVCDGKVCGFYEPKNTEIKNFLDDYRTLAATFARFHLVSGSLLEPNFNTTNHRFRVVSESKELYYADN